MNERVRKAVDLEAGKLAGRYIDHKAAPLAHPKVWQKAMQLTGGSVKDIWIHGDGTAVSVPAESIQSRKVRRELGLR